MEVILEEVLFINLFQCFIILKSVALILRQKGRLILLSSIIGSVISLLVPLYSFHFLIKLLLIILTASLLLLISFKYKTFKNFILQFAVFLFSTFLFGGGCFALQSLIGQFPLFIVSVVGLGIYIVLCVVIKIVSHHSRLKNFTYKLVFKDGDKVISEEGYLDSGNVLYDTITKKPIVLVSFDVFKKFYEDVSYLSALTKKVDSSSIKNGHYIKINGVGHGTSMLIFTVDELQIEGEREYKNVSLGLSFSGFERSFGKGVLLHCDYS